MRACFVKRLRAWTLAAGWFVVAGAPVQGQMPAPCPPVPCPPAGVPSYPAPSVTPAVPQREVPSPTPAPAAPTAPETAAPSTPTAPTAPETAAPSAPTAPGTDLSALASLTSGAAGTETAAVSESRTGYIDAAQPFTNFRLRYDGLFDANAPDRAEFFYSRNSFNFVASGPPGAPFGNGTFLRPAVNNTYPTQVDFRDLSAYLEVAPAERFSVFVEAPYVWVDPAEIGIRPNGFGDVNAGLKYAFVYTPQTVFTGQFRTYVPTGLERLGLGTGHVSLEPALLLHQALTPRLAFDSELSDWIPVGGTDFAGNVLLYGSGLSYDVIQRPGLYVSPVTELVGWTVLSGQELLSNPPEVVGPGQVNQALAIKSAAGETIVNLKLGVRIGLGDHNEIYAGYGRALTGTFWYKDLFRLEYRLVF